MKKSIAATREKFAATKAAANKAVTSADRQKAIALLTSVITAICDRFVAAGYRPTIAKPYIAFPEVQSLGFAGIRSLNDLVKLSGIQPDELVAVGLATATEGTGDHAGKTFYKYHKAGGTVAKAAANKAVATTADFYAMLK